MSVLRRLVAMLRQPGDDDQLAPQPSLRHLSLLVAQVQQTGLVVDLDDSCGQDGIQPGVDLSAYRIAQEALTNVLKHSKARPTSRSWERRPMVRTRRWRCGATVPTLC